MRKNILIHIGSLNAGGAEKSLVSLLSTMPKDKYDIDLLLVRKDGLLMDLLPSHINILETPLQYNCYSNSPKNIGFYIRHNPKYLIKKLYTAYKYKKKKNNKESLDQCIWSIWKDTFKPLEKKYDVAISYLEGITNYYIIDKVNAKKKLIWIHNEYDKLGYSRDFDMPYFKKADAIVTISQLCKENLVKNFPLLKERIHVLENICNPKLICDMANAEIDDPLFNCSAGIFRILTIGRLTPQKNYLMAIDSARILKDKGIDFRWYIIGAGPLKADIERRISEQGLDNHVILLGLRANPYAYMKQCNIVVQSSIFEGKSIVLDEAKILCKPIVATCYNTVYDTIEDGINGVITEMTPESLANGIYNLLKAPEERIRYSKYLRENMTNNMSELNKYINLID